MAKSSKPRRSQLAQPAPKSGRDYPAPADPRGSFYGQIKQSQYISQLHDPDDVEKYEGLYPGATKILFEEFQRQSEHRRHIETIVVQGNVKQQERGPIYGMIIILLALIIGTVLTVRGFSTEGIALLIGALATPTAVFITGRVAQQIERHNKERNS